MMASCVVNSPSCEFEESDIIEIVSAEEYDSQRAKLRASLAWLKSKAYGTNVPRDLQDPFYENSEGQLLLRPVMVNLLSSSELYCIVCGKIFPETHTQWRGHWSIIQTLSRKGIYINDVQDTSVTETVLVQTAPFRLKAHLALMDALMRAYLAEIASVERVAKAVRQFTSFNASTELPSNPEEALQFWVNKVGHTLSTNGPVNSSVETQQTLIEGETTQKVRIMAKSPSPRDQQAPQVSVPPMDDLMRDIGDGCAIAAVIAFYRPGQLSTSDICLKSEIGIADSLYNLRQIGNFCKSHLPWSSFHLSYEDFLYTHETMKTNIYTFVADLFYTFAAAPKILPEKSEVIHAAGKKSGQTIVSVPISSATKKSFQKIPLEDTGSNLGLSPLRSPIGGTPSHQPLLARRAAAAASSGDHQTFPGRRGRRVQSLSSPQERDLIHRSVIAWNDDQKLSARTNSEDRALLANVSIDSTLDQSIEFEPGLSLELTALDTPRVPNESILEDPNHPDYMEVESVHSTRPSTERHSSSRVTSNPATPSSSPYTQQQQKPEGREPLMPAVLRPTKEKVMSKAEERGDRIMRKRGTSTSPQSPSNPPVVGIVNDGDGSTTSSWSDETCVTPLPQEEMPSQEPLLKATPTQPSQVVQAAGRKAQAFVIGTDESLDSLTPIKSFSQLSPPTSARSDTHSVAESYTIPDRPQTAMDAVRAGIPVVSDLMEGSATSHQGPPGDTHPSQPSREGSVASSGEYSDHESLKIHQDHKNRESVPSSKPSSLDERQSSEKCDPKEEKLSLVILDNTKSGDVRKTSPNTTNFAELKRLKDLKFNSFDKVDNSGLIYMQTGVHWDANADGQPGGLGSNLPRPALQQQPLPQQQPQQTDGGKHTVTFQSPPLTSWQQQSNGAVSGDFVSGGGGDGSGDAGTNNAGGGSELQQLRLKLEQKRKEIERKKHRMEAQQNKMRQHLGKAAFMRVVSKHMDVPEIEGDPNVSSSRTLPSANSAHAQLQARLGHPGPRLPLSSTSALSLPPPPSSSSSSNILPFNPATTTQQIHLGGLGDQTMLTSNASGQQRLTDWCSQSQLAKGNRAQPQQSSSSQQNATMTAAHQENGGSQWETGSISDASSNGSSNSSNAQQKASAMTKTFSREGIQQTIDNIRNKWFKNDDSDLISTSQQESDEDEMDGGSFSRPPTHHQMPPPPPQPLHSHSLSPPRSRPVSQHSPTTPPHHGHFEPTSTLPYYHNNPAAYNVNATPTTRASSTPPAAIPARNQARRTSDNDSSFDKLSSSLTDLQEEIMHMSLQNEQPGQGTAVQPPGFGRDIVGMSDALAMIRGGGPSPRSTTLPNRPIHGIPNQSPYIHRSLTPSHMGEQLPYQQPAVIGEGGNINMPYHPQYPTTGFNSAADGDLTPTASHPPISSDASVDKSSRPPHSDSESVGYSLAINPSMTTSGDGDAKPQDGFFIAFGDEPQPKRPKPKLTDRSSGSTSSGDTPAAKRMSSDSDVSPQGASLEAPQVVDAVDRSRARSQSPHVGFVVTDTTDVQDQVDDSEMQRKKIKLLEMQRKRKEGQERKRQEKEAELAKKMEEKMLKEEEQEKKKADEKARREVIFQQYMQKKTEEEEGGPPAPKPRPERRSGSKPRPKSMFVKSKAMTPEPGARGMDSTNSSQEDLAARQGSPSLMSAMRSSYHFRVPGKMSMRKAVSCNTLSANGSNGGSTYRRPPSPDLYRIRQQRQRGNSQDSGSETGSGSNPGSDYAGPKLFVKPSAKSNRHIIVNAISHCCLAGSVNNDSKNKVLQEMSKCDANHFLILFRDAGCKYRGLFIFYPDTEEAFKILGVGPKHITNDMCEKFYKYNSGGKSFTEIVSTKHLSVSVDAVVLLGSVWKSGKAAVRR